MTRYFHGKPLLYLHLAAGRATKHWPRRAYPALFSGAVPWEILARKAPIEPPPPPMAALP